MTAHKAQAYPIRHNSLIDVPVRGRAVSRLRRWRRDLNGHFRRFQ